MAYCYSLLSPLAMAKLLCIDVMQLALSSRYVSRMDFIVYNTAVKFFMYLNIDRDSPYQGTYKCIYMERFT